MSREFVITTESNSDMPESFLQENGIGVIPHYYTVDGELYGDGKEMTIPEFYDAMRKQKKVATMASNPAVILERFTAYAKQGKDILHVSFASSLSGGYGNICAGAAEVMEEHPEMTIKVVDTLSASLGEGILLKKAVDMRAAGKSLEETEKELNALAPHLCAQFIVDDLNHLYRGGRLSKTTAIVGTLANIKPILHIDAEGRLTPMGKARGKKKAMEQMLNLMEERLGSFKDKQEFIGIIHGDCENEAKQLADMVEKRLGYTKFQICPIGPSIGVHSGPGTLALIFLGDYR